MAEPKSPPPDAGGYRGSSPSAVARHAAFDHVRKYVVAFTAGVAVLFGAYTQVIHDARAEVDAGVQKVNARIDAGELRQRSTEEEVRQVKAEVKETQQDIRALYRALRTGQRQQRLEDAGTDVP